MSLSLQKQGFMIRLVQVHAWALLSTYMLAAPQMFPWKLQYEHFFYILYYVLDTFCNICTSGNNITENFFNLKLILYWNFYYVTL